MSALWPAMVAAGLTGAAVWLVLPVRPDVGRLEERAEVGGRDRLQVRDFAQRVCDRLQQDETRAVHRMAHCLEVVHVHEAEFVAGRLEVLPQEREGSSVERSNVRVEACAASCASPPTRC